MRRKKSKKKNEPKNETTKGSSGEKHVDQQYEELNGKAEKSRDTDIHEKKAEYGDEAAGPDGKGSGSRRNDEPGQRNESRENEAGSGRDMEQLVLDQQEEIARLQNKIEDLKESNLRKTAELDNARKRMERERAQIYEASRAAAVKEFLTVNDDLQRTLKALEDSDGKSSEGIVDGVRMVAKKFEEALQHFDVERIDQTGVPFDVDLHDALLRRKPEDENVGSDIVLQVLENGYKMGDRTIRHAKVIVSE